MQRSPAFAVLPQLKPQPSQRQLQLLDQLMNAILNKQPGNVRTILASVKNKDEKAFILNTRINDSTGDSPLYWACVVGNLDTVVTLVSNGANPEISDYFRNKPLHIAAENGYANIVDYFIRLFISKGTAALLRYVNEENMDEDTPLSLAIANGYDEIAQKLTRAGANIKVHDAHHKTNATSQTT